MNVSQPAIHLNDVRVLRGERWIIDGVTLTIPVGACAALLGPNGCGKSTLMRIASGYLWASRGTTHVLGETLGEVDVPTLRRSIRLVQSTGDGEPAPEATAVEVVLTGYFGTAWLFDPVTAVMRNAATMELTRVGLAHVADHAFATLSMGEKMRCLIARALVVRPRLLLLDEPTAGLDLVGREQVLATIASLHERDKELTIVLTTHHLEELPTTTSQVVLMSQGLIVADGPPEEVLVEGKLSKAYGVAVSVVRSQGRYFATAKLQVGQADLAR